jgi:hypothetical protein
MDLCGSFVDDASQHGAMGGDPAAMIWLRKDRKIPVIVLRCKTAVMGYGDWRDRR